MDRDSLRTIVIEEPLAYFGSLSLMQGASSSQSPRDQAQWHWFYLATSREGAGI